MCNFFSFPHYRAYNEYYKRCKEARTMKRGRPKANDPNNPHKPEAIESESIDVDLT